MGASRCARLATVHPSTCGVQPSGQRSTRGGGGELLLCSAQLLLPPLPHPSRHSCEGCRTLPLNVSLPVSCPDGGSCGGVGWVLPAWRHQRGRSRISTITLCQRRRRRRRRRSIRVRCGFAVSIVFMAHEVAGVRGGRATPSVRPSVCVLQCCCVLASFRASHHSFVDSFFHPFLQSCIHPSLHAFTHSFIHSLTHSLTHSL